MTDFTEALKRIAQDVVGVDPHEVDDTEYLRWEHIRAALEVRQPKPFQRKCWQAGVIKDHLCGPHCENEATQEEIDAFVEEYRRLQYKEYENMVRRAFGK